MKKYPHGLTLNAVCAAIDDYQRHEDSVPEEGILAAFNTLLGHSDIADALRSMERTADVNMAAAQAMRDDIYHWKQRAEAAEAKLSGLEKQEESRWNTHDGIARPIGVDKDDLVYLRMKRQEIKLPYPAGMVNWKHDGGEFDVIAWASVYSSHRPAPAADLAEMVPPGWKLVPVEPTKHMLEASYREASVYSRTAYRAMLAAAPTPPE